MDGYWVLCRLGRLRWRSVGTEGEWRGAVIEPRTK